jgi:hypothetical protein
MILIMGKGGVGKTTVARATARHLAAQGRRTLLVHALQLNEEKQVLAHVAPNLWEITLRASDCFREYIMLKLKVKALYTAFMGTVVTQYLERAAPGVREMVMLGKIWYERRNYDHVVVDMPSTGYALTMIHTPFNFSEVFPGGPIYWDAQEIVQTLIDPTQSACVTVSLAEEMPAQESVELAAHLIKLLPSNPSWLVMNRLLRLPAEARKLHAERWPKLGQAERAAPLWRALDHFAARFEKQERILAGMALGWAPYTKNWLEIYEGQVEEAFHGGR